MRARIAAVMVVALVAVGMFGVVGSAGAQSGTSSVTVVHGVPGLTVDVYVNGDLFAAGYEPGELLGPVDLPAATYQIDVYGAGADPDAQEPAISEAVALPAGVNASLVAHLTEDGAPTLSAFVNDVSALRSGESRVVVRHTAAAPAVDVRADGAVAFADLANPDEASADLPTGTYTVDVVPTGEDAPVVIGPADLSFPAGTSTIVYAVGSLEGDSLGVVVQSIADLPVAARTAGRVAGDHRFTTAVEISKRAFPQGADTVYLARADIGVDALAGGSLTDGPILLVPSCGDVPAAVKAEIDRLDPDEVLALGGPAAICDATLADAASS
jgi:hypothetical protein